MPLTATLDGARVDSVLSTEHEWLELKRAYKTKSLVMSCGLPAFPRTSNLGLRHFVHKGGVKCSLVECWSETPQHRAAKSIVARAAADAGWMVTIEHPAADRSWVADVLVAKDGRQVALEIQWSKQSSPEFASRQDRYTEDGVECFWFVHRRNAAAASEAGVPHVVFDGGALPLDVLAHGAFQPDAPTPLADFTRYFLDGAYLPRAESKAVAVTLELVEMPCFACHRTSTVWRLGSVDVRTRCQQVASFERLSYGSSWSLERLETLLYAEANAAVEGWPPLAPLRKHYSNTTKSSYLAYGCAHCSRGFFGDYFIMTNFDWTEVTLPTTTRIPLSEEMQADRHICVDHGSERCSQQQIEHAGPVFDGHLVTEPRPKMEEPAFVEVAGESTSREQAPDESTGAELPMSGPNAGASTHQPRQGNGLCDLCGTDPHPEFTCLWRRYRALVRVAAGGHHFSDDIHARIASGEMGEADGTQVLRRMLVRVAEHKDALGLSGSVQELEDDVAAGRPLTRYR